MGKRDSQTRLAQDALQGQTDNQVRDRFQDQLANDLIERRTISTSSNELINQHAVKIGPLVVAFIIGAVLSFLIFGTLLGMAGIVNQNEVCANAICAPAIGGFFGVIVELIRQKPLTSSK